MSRLICDETMISDKLATPFPWIVGSSATLRDSFASFTVPFTAKTNAYIATAVVTIEPLVNKELRTFPKIRNVAKILENK